MKPVKIKQENPDELILQFEDGSKKIIKRNDEIDGLDEPLRELLLLAMSPEKLVTEEVLDRSSSPLANLT